MLSLKWDGHTHTHFCYHGNPAELPEYVHRAIDLGFGRYSVTEHPPLPINWVPDERLLAELAMPEEQLPDYIAYVSEMKKRFAGRIDLVLGLEMDFLYKNESFSDRLLEPYMEQLDDAVVSVHYLPGAGGMRCVDFTADDFKQNLLAYYGSMDRVADAYFDHVEMAIAWAARLPMRKRLGHVNLIEKFAAALPAIDESLLRRRLEGLLPKLKEAGVGIDVNVAGLRVPTCGKVYVPLWFIHACREQGIELVYGSDAHRPEHVGAGWDWFENHVAQTHGAK